MKKVPAGDELVQAIWQAIDQYVWACGGHPTNTGRQGIARAIARLERAAIARGLDVGTAAHNGPKEEPK